MHERGSRSAPELVWCQKGCGHNVHARCLNVWAKHQTTLKQELTCPMCRTPWGPFCWRPPAALQRAHHKHAAHHGSHCKGCEQGPVVGSLYTCMTCARLQLCSGCFEAGKHPQHSFSCCAHPGAPDQPAQRDLQAQLLTGLTCSRTAGSVQLLMQNHTSPSSSQLSRRAPGQHTSSVLMEMNQPGCGTQPDRGLAALSIGFSGGSMISSQPLQRSGSSRLNSSNQAGSSEQIVAKKGVPKPASAGTLCAGVPPTPTSEQYSLQDIVGMGYDQGNNRQAARQAEGQDHGATGQPERQPEGQISKGIKGQAERRLSSSSRCERQNRPFLGRAQQQSSCAAALCIPSHLSQCQEPSSSASLQPISVQGLNNSLAGPDQQKPCRCKPAKQASNANKGRTGRARAAHQQADAAAPGAKGLHPAVCLQAEGKGFR
ncbi:TPA: hypothetical protein ACH3X1_007921 [Trebouxia sp. C0004]